MQTFETAAVVGLIDNMSGPLKQLASHAKQAAKMIEFAKLDPNNVAAYTNRLNSATRSAERHLSVVNRIHGAWKGAALLASTVGSSIALAKARDAVKSYVPLERENRYMQAVGVQRDANGRVSGYGFSNADMAKLLEQQKTGAHKYGENPLDTAHAQMAFAQRQISAETTRILTDQSLILAKALGTSTKEAALILEGSIFAKGKSDELNTPEGARRTAQRYADIAAVMSKSGAMSAEDINQFGKYGYSIAKESGLSDETVAAIGMTLKRANMPGMESGTMLRQLASRLMSPTREGRQAMIAQGVDIDKYSTSGAMSGGQLSGLVKERFGKAITPDAIKAIDAKLEDSTIAGSKPEFVKTVSEMLFKQLGANKARDRERVAKAVGDYWQFKRASVDGEGMLAEILKKSGGLGLLNFLGVKQGARGAVITGELDKYFENLEAVKHGVEVGRASEVAAERMKGLAFETDKLSSSLESAKNSLVNANTGWLVPTIQRVSEALRSIDNMSDTGKIVTTAAAALGTLGAAVLSFVGTIKIAKSIMHPEVPKLPGLPEARAAAVEKAPYKFSWLKGVESSNAPEITRIRGAAPIGKIGRLFTGLNAIAWGLEAYYEANELYDVATGRGSESSRDLKRLGSAYHRARLAKEAKKRAIESKFGGMPSDLSAVHGLDLSALQETSGGWADSTVQLKRPAQGNARWGDGQTSRVAEVTGSVTGQAEIHSSIQLEVKPTAYFESKMQRLESMSTMGLSGRLGTGMMGGDNATKPASPTGTQQ